MEHILDARLLAKEIPAPTLPAVVEIHLTVSNHFTSNRDRSSSMSASDTPMPPDNSCRKNRTVLE